MSRLLLRCCVAGLLTLPMVRPSWGRQTGQAGQPSQSGGSSADCAPGTQSNSNPSCPAEARAPLVLSGRVVMDSSQPVPEPVSVGLNCLLSTVQVVHTDLKGFFQFTLGGGDKSNLDLSASNGSPMTTAGGNVTVGELGGLGGSTKADGFGAAGGSGLLFGSSGDSFVGCELRVSVAGYQQLVKTITDSGDIGGINAGTLQLTRLAGVTGSAISVTSLQIPDDARAEFDQGDKDARSKHLEPATQHLTKAVAEYPKYAAAWNELGDVYAATHAPDKAHQAYEKAIASDPGYTPPYVSLAVLELQDGQYESAAGTAGKALELDPSIGLASYIQGGADFKLNRLDDAEKSLLQAEKQPHQSIAQLHAMLAQIYVQKRDYPDAAAQMRAYLKEAPQGRLAGEIKQNLEQMQKAGADRNANASPDQPQIAP
jgi:hypothetical protein